MTTPLPGLNATQSRSPLYIDGIPVALASAPKIAQGPQPPAGQRFWSSHPRGYGDQTNEMMIVTLSTARLINYISLDLPHFPSQYSLAWRDVKGAWHWIAGPNGIVLQFVISGSIPALVNSAAALTAGQNPYHYGADHWIHYDEPIRPVTAGAIMLAGTRALETVIKVSPGTLPRDASGRICPYPLGVRNLDFGYRVINRTDVPYTTRHNEIVTERQAFAVAEDINGSPVQLTLRENRASDLLGGVPWKCAPQPFSSAVVCLYADARDATSQPQVIDRFFIEPTTAGVNLNLYYTTEAPSAGFQAVDTPLSTGSVAVNGSILPSVDAEGLIFGNAPGWLTLKTQATGADFTRPFWMGWEVQPQFAAADTGSYMICDAGRVQLWFANGRWLITMRNGVSLLASWPATHAANDRLQFAFGWDGAQIYAWSAQGGTMGITATSVMRASSEIWFGAPLAATQQALALSSIWPGRFRLTSFIIKQEGPAPDPVLGGVPVQFTEFAAGPGDYVMPPGGTGPTTVNACCRWDPALVLGAIPGGIAPYGFAGGVGTSWTAATWIPVQLQWKLATGYLQFTPVRAAGFKFEFTNLVPQPYEFYTETPQKAKIFPVAPPDAPASAPPPASATQAARSAVLSGPNTPVGTTPYPPSADTGMVVNASLAPQNFFADQPAGRVPPAAGIGLPTEALYGSDPYSADTLQQRGGSLFNFQPWQAPPQGAPRQQVSGTEIYQEVQVNAASRVAYFVGLSALAMYRQDYTAASDTAEYIDTFGDTAGIDPASLAAPATGATVPWSWAPGLLSVPVNLAPGSVAQLTSPVLTALHQVTGVQFAAVQSPPLQLLPDPSFINTSLPYIEPVGDALPLSLSAGTNSPLGSMVMVTRSPGQLSWNAMMASYPLWSSFAVAPPAPAAPPTAVTAQGLTTGTSGSRAYPCTGTSKAGDTLLVVVGGNATTAGITALTDSRGNVYTLDHALTTDPVYGTFWRSPGATGGSGGGLTAALSTSDTYTVTCNGAVSLQVTLFAVAATVGPLDVQGFASTSSALTYGASVTPNAPDEIAIAMAMHQLAGGAPSAAAPFATGQVYSGTNQIHSTAYDMDTGPSGIPVTCTITATANCNGRINVYSFLPAGTAGTRSWAQLQGVIDTSTSPYGGVAYSGDPVAVSASGRVHIAARVFADRALTTPLMLQLLDGASGAVVAEQEVTVSGGTVTEWFASYTLGQPQVASSLTWSGVQSAYATWAATSGFSWDDIDSYMPPLGATLSWQLVQQGLTGDTWGVDDVSIFEDSIVWQFSNDGGATFTPAYDINANPSGALVFPPAAAGKGTQLCWRVLGYRPNLTVASIAIRPWYSCYPRGVPPRIPGLPHGPNVCHRDLYGPVKDDPYWQTWAGPVPQAWYFTYSQLLGQANTYVQPQPSPLQPAELVLGRGLPVPETASPAGPVTYSDIYSANYTDSYGVPDGSDIFTDVGGNGYYLSYRGPTP